MLFHRGRLPVNMREEGVKRDVLMSKLNSNFLWKGPLLDRDEQ